MGGAKVLPSSFSRKQLSEKKDSSKLGLKGSQKISSVSDLRSKKGDGPASKKSNRRNDLDDMNKSIDSMEEHTKLDSNEETTKIPILVTTKHVKGHNPEL